MVLDLCSSGCLWLVWHLAGYSWVVSPIVWASWRQRLLGAWPFQPGCLRQPMPVPSWNFVLLLGSCAVFLVPHLRSRHCSLISRTGSPVNEGWRLEFYLVAVTLRARSGRPFCNTISTYRGGARLLAICHSLRSARCCHCQHYFFENRLRPKTRLD